MAEDDRKASEPSTREEGEIPQQVRCCIESGVIESIAMCHDIELALEVSWRLDARWKPTFLSSLILAKTTYAMPCLQERNGEPDFTKKHPLEYKWTLWFDNPKGSQKPSTWGQTLRAVYTFDTVEDFWW
jgi:hypothetical protein